MNSNIIKIKFRNELVHILKEEIESLSSNDWFLTNLIKYPTESGVYEIWEDKNTVMSIFDSLKHNSLIIYPGVSLDYLLILCDKWIVPDELIEQIQKKKEEEIQQKEKSKLLGFLEDFPLQCNKCNKGYKLNENKSNSCKIHTDKYCIINKYYICCRGINPCSESYHTLFNMSQHYVYLPLFEKLEKIFNIDEVINKD
jgi:hypothetical protein